MYLLSYDSRYKAPKGINLLGQSFGREQWTRMFLDDGFQFGVHLDQMRAGFLEQFPRRRGRSGRSRLGRRGILDRIWVSYDSGRLGRDQHRIRRVRLRRSIDRRGTGIVDVSFISWHRHQTHVGWRGRGCQWMRACRCILHFPFLPRRS